MQPRSLHKGGSLSIDAALAWVCFSCTALVAAFLTSFEFSHSAPSTRTENPPSAVTDTFNVGGGPWGSRSPSCAVCDGGLAAAPQASAAAASTRAASEGMSFYKSWKQYTQTMKPRLSGLNIFQGPEFGRLGRDRAVLPRFLFRAGNRATGFHEHAAPSHISSHQQ